MIKSLLVVPCCFLSRQRSKQTDKSKKQSERFKSTNNRFLEENTLVLLLKPFHGLHLGNLVLAANVSAALLPPVHAEAGASHNNVKVHAVNTSVGIVLEAKVNVLFDAKSKVSSLAEVLPLELVLLNLESTLDDLHGLFSADGDVAGNLFVTADAEGADGVAGLRLHDLLSGERLEDLAGPSETIAAFSDRDVENKLLDAKLAHFVFSLLNGKKKICQQICRVKNKNHASSA